VSGLQLDLRRMIARQLGLPEHVLNDDVALEDIGLDSMQIAEIVIAIERDTTRPLDISDLSEEIEPGQSLGQFITLLEERIGRAGAAEGG
jgi:acyl carrier protein